MEGRKNITNALNNVERILLVNGFPAIVWFLIRLSYPSEAVRLILFQFGVVYPLYLFSLVLFGLGFLKLVTSSSAFAKILDSLSIVYGIFGLAFVAVFV